jgi:CBS domain-containing protein
MARVSQIIDATMGSQRPVTSATILKRARGNAEDSLPIPHVHSDQPLGLALARMGDSGHNVLPVVSRANARMIIGVVTIADVLQAYGVDASRMTPSQRMPAVK